MNMLHKTLPTASLLTAAACLSLTLQAAAAGDVEKAFRISGEGVGPEGLPLPGEAPRPHWIIGTATHLGVHDGDGFVQTDTAFPVFDDDGNLIGFNGEFGSGLDGDGNPLPFEFCAANGDKLVCVYGRTQFGASEPGSFELTIVDVLPGGLLVVEALWIAEFVPLAGECTGRFEGVSGSWIMYAWSEPFVLGTSDPVGYAWEGAGRLTFRN